jgi:hypothetical protein
MSHYHIIFIIVISIALTYINLLKVLVLLYIFNDIMNKYSAQNGKQKLKDAIVIVARGSCFFKAKGKAEG